MEFYQSLTDVGVWGYPTPAAPDFQAGEGKYTTSAHPNHPAASKWKGMD